MPREDKWPCDCEQLQRIALSDVWPLSYDRNSNSFRLYQRHGKGADGGFLRIQFCPLCGAGLEQSGGSEVAEDIIEQIDNLKRKLESAESIEEVQSILGQPARRLEIERECDDEFVEYSQFVFDEGDVQVWATIRNNDELSISFTPNTGKG